MQEKELLLLLLLLSDSTTDQGLSAAVTLRPGRAFFLCCITLEFRFLEASAVENMGSCLSPFYGLIDSVAQGLKDDCSRSMHAHADSWCMPCSLPWLHSLMQREDALPQPCLTASQGVAPNDTEYMILHHLVRCPTCRAKKAKSLRNIILQ